MCFFMTLATVFAVRDDEEYMPGYTIFEPLGPPQRYTMAEVMYYRPPPPVFNFAGFRISAAYEATYTIRYGRLYTIPFWFLSLVYAVLPSIWLRRRRREWRAARAQRMWKAEVCPGCGYDLRASPQRCPECGMKTELATDGAQMNTDEKHG